jgi:asparagine synthase (glutamine-hydrolysing)
MCGLNAIFANRDAAPPPNDRELIATRDHMAARGPDGKGQWRSKCGRAAFGHRRLAIVDLDERSIQPMVSQSGRYVIAFKGEIYNYRELRAKLLDDGVPLRTQSDTEVLLELFARDGIDALERLSGMFAFAIWDQHLRKLYLARDSYGIKPLYFDNDRSTVRVASQVKALIAGGAVSRDVDPAGVVGFYLWGSVPELFTLYRTI